MKASINNTNTRYVCAGERLKIIGTVNGLFPDMGHHSAKEMNGVWLHPIKLLDGFWLRFEDHSTDGEVNAWLNADSFTNHPYGNEFHYGQGLSHTQFQLTRFQFSPDSVCGGIVTYSFYNHSAQPRDITVEFLARADLRPVWFSETVGIFDGDEDVAHYDDARNLFLAKDAANAWYAALGCDAKPLRTRTGQFFGPENTAGKGVSMSMEFDRTVAPFATEVLTFYIAGSDLSREDCLAHYARLAPHEDLLSEKKARYDQIAARSALRTCDPSFDQIYGWIKVNTDWLIQATSAHGRGLTAGLPEYPWWFGCDNCYAIEGLLAIGEIQLARDTLTLLLEASARANGNGRIVHEVITNGAVCNPGNTQETAHFVATVWAYYLWTGDETLIKACFPYLQKSMAWLKEMDDDGDLFPSGYGIIEIAGLNMEMIDSAVYTCQAHKAFAGMCRMMGQADVAAEHEALSRATRDAINEVFWNEQRGLYCDAVTSTSKVKEQLEEILFHSDTDDGEIRSYLTAQIAQREGDGKESGWLLNEAWVIVLPMEAGLATQEQADRALAHLHTDRFIGPYGAYLSGLNHQQTMTISTGAYAVSQARYGYSDRALDLLKRTFSTFGMATPGSLSEMSPDYGCFAQGWTVYGAGVVPVRYFFGLQPDAEKGEILLAPNMPAAWEEGELLNVNALDGTLSIRHHREHGVDHFLVDNHTSFPLRIDPSRSARPINVST